MDYVHNSRLTFELRTMSAVEGVLVPPAQQKHLDGIGVWVTGKGVVTLWPTEASPPSDRIEGLGVHFDDNSSLEVWHA